MATRDREVLESDRVLRAATYGRAGSRDLERRSRPTLGLESQDKSDPRYRRRFGLDLVDGIGDLDAWSGGRRGCIFNQRWLLGGDRDRSGDRLRHGRGGQAGRGRVRLGL
jgi:hypothetical protein